MDKKSSSRIIPIVPVAVMLIVVFAACRAVGTYFPLPLNGELSEALKTYAPSNQTLVLAIIRTESNFRSNIVSPKGAKGLMQLTDATAEWGARELKMGAYDVFKTRDNVRIGCWYIEKLFEQFGNKDVALAAYNAGSGNVTKWLQDTRYSQNGQTLSHIPFPETENYVKRVNDRVRVYTALQETRRIIGSKFYSVLFGQ